MKGQGHEAAGEVFEEGMSEKRASLSRQRDREGPDVRTCKQVTCVASCQDCAGCWWRLDRGWETKAKAR